MAIVSLSSLKQRFVTGDTPSAKDFSDLIDTLSNLATAVPSHSIPLSALEITTPNVFLQTDGSGNVTATALSFGAVTGDGSLTGTYPGLSVAADGVQNGHIADHTIQLVKFNTSGVASGAVPTFSGGVLQWLVPGSSSTSARNFGQLTNINYAPVLFTIDGGNNISDITFANTYNALPVSTSYLLECTSTDGSYAVGAVVDINEVVNASFENAFSVEATATTFTIHANVLANVIQIGATSITLSKWQLVVNAIYAMSDAALLPPTAIRLQGARAAVPYSGSLLIAHALVTDQSASTYPSNSGRGYGYDSSGRAIIQSFLSKVDLKNANIVIGASVTGGNPFPTSDLANNGVNSGCFNTFGCAQLNAVRWPTSSANRLMWIRGNDNYLPSPSGTSPNIQTLILSPSGANNVSAVDLDTGALTTYGAVTPIGTNATLTDVWAFNTGASNNYLLPQHLAIVQIDETGMYGSTHPILYVVGSQLFPLPVNQFKANLAACAFGKLTWNGSNYVLSGPTADVPNNKPSLAINWLHTGIVNNSTGRLTDIFSAATSYNPVYYSMVRYNPVKQRFYIIDAVAGLLHIFTLSNTVSLLTWGITGVLDYTKLTYTGSYVIPIGPSRVDIMTSGDNESSNGQPNMRDQWTVEFDLVTGNEKALCYTCGLLNTVTYIPWVWP